MNLIVVIFLAVFVTSIIQCAGWLSSKYGLPVWLAFLLAIGIGIIAWWAFTLACRTFEGRRG